MSQPASLSSTPTMAEHAAGMLEYTREGERSARQIGNRGPLQFDANGKLHPDILAAYWETGFYVFEGVIDPGEVEALRAGTNEMIERAPVRRDAEVDSKGRPALGLDYARKPYTLIKPLSDPWGGTELLGGRHPSQMSQPAPSDDAPEEVVFLMYGMCQAMESGLRLYGHPQLLAVAESINGADFVPFNDAIFVKQAGVGGAVAWHQDGVTHWQSPKWDKGIHGFNFQVQLYASTPANCLWVVPGTHTQGRVDIKSLVAGNGGSERLPGAVPLTCQAGDVTLANRQLLHGSFANTSPHMRVSITFGFHRRTSVLGAKAALAVQGDEFYDEQRIFDRSAVIAVAIDARQQHFPAETPYRYQPFAGLEEEYGWNEANVERVIRDYNLKDLAI